ncbi:MAG: alpha/beta fold hydrolase [Pseudomonadales bacterium]|nr:alpha/beta hydrolase [Pseudomonadales bacterium]NIX06608.1 alpha/beta fold hydrolase [Pseudomonadales bacterium]
MRTVKGSLNIGRFEVPYRRYGDSDHLLMCVSGALQTMAIWRTVVKRFAERYTVVIFDMPGIGRSEITSGGAHVTVQEQLETVHALIEENQTGGEVTLAGSSWGTAIAAAYAALRPDEVQHLILSSFGMKANSVMEDIVRRALVLYHEGDYARGADLILEMFGGQIGEAYRRQIIAQFAQLNDAHAEAFYEHCRNILKLGNLTDIIDLSRIKARTFIINGAEDTIIDLEDMYIAQRLIPNCQVRLIEGVGHFLHFERPELLDDYAEFMIGSEALAG